VLCELLHGPCSALHHTPHQRLRRQNAGQHRQWKMAWLSFHLSAGTRSQLGSTTGVAPTPSSRDMASILAFQIGLEIRLASFRLDVHHHHEDAPAGGGGARVRWDQPERVDILTHHHPCFGPGKLSFSVPALAEPAGRQDRRERFVSRRRRVDAAWCQARQQPMLQFPQARASAHPPPPLDTTPAYALWWVRQIMTPSTQYIQVYTHTSGELGAAGAARPVAWAPIPGLITLSTAPPVDRLAGSASTSLPPAGSASEGQTRRSSVHT
jgi:hypothetical protein